MSDMDMLLSFRSWRVDKISPTTYAPDAKCPRQYDTLIRAGVAYRCRIGRGPYHFGCTVAAAVKAAVDAEISRDVANAPEPR